MKREKHFCALFIAITAALPIAARPQESNAEKYPPGLFTATVMKGSPVEQAGLKQGDILLFFNGEPLRFDSQLQPLRDKARWAGEKTAVLTVRRASANLRLKVALGPLLGVAGRPPLPEAAQKLFDAAEALPKEQAVDKLAGLRAAAVAAQGTGDDRAAAWLWQSVAYLAPAGSKERLEAQGNEVAYAGKAGDMLLVARAAIEFGIVVYGLGRMDEALTLYKQSLAIRERLAPNSIDLSIALNNVGYWTLEHRQINEAEPWFKRALAIQDRLAPGSAQVAGFLRHLGYIASTRGKSDEADAYYRRLLEIEERLEPGSVDEADTLNWLARLAGQRGNKDLKNEYQNRAIAILAKLPQDSAATASSLSTLGETAASTGKYQDSLTYYRRALAILEPLEPDSMEVARILFVMGYSALFGGSVGDAQTYFSRSLKIREKLVPGSTDVAASLYGMALVALAHIQVDEARDITRKALAISRKVVPTSDYTVMGELLLGLIAYVHGNLEEEESYFNDAWSFVIVQGQQVSGDSGRQQFGQFYAQLPDYLIDIQLRRQRFDGAFATLETGRAQAMLQALSERGITEKVTPRPVWLAYQSAVQAHALAYKNSERAVLILENAKQLLSALTEQKADDAAIHAKHQELDAAEQAFKASQLEEMRTRSTMDTSWGDVRRAANAAVPVQVDTAQLRKRLPPGTLLLEFSASANGVTLFAVSADSVKAYTLPAKRDELEAKVAFIRRYVARDSDDRAAKLVSNNSIEQDALRALFSKLFPAEAQVEIQRARHIVISPDEFLWDLPFAALITNTSGAPQYLGLQKPLSYAQSLTVLLTPSSPGSSHGAGVLAIGNPLYDNSRRKESGFGLAQSKAVKSGPGSVSKLVAARRDGELGMLTSDGAAPPQLEYAEQEARQIAALYPHTVAHTGAEPTESWFREHASNARILHLATHGFYNPYSAQSSGVLLAVPETAPPAGQYDNDGTLQAWEVWSLKLKADLVVLSACETGRGAKVTGEGLIGMTRAWQYAGAKTILSSQWKVNDRSTASLMTAFHKHLLAGAERDEALRLAMSEIANSKTPGWSSPYHWAAFVMVGETGKMP